ncbi:hypothetical protein B296_00057155 [Ensete ventricosum]|uniref:Uncharacterized protein n=1 Tax=Ensete ventricosum TaxID=4639 RepID=A0A426WVZ1_ENSVE|nr:hypothetical protein B296_00057155 [Ensete ventricosum]
MKIQYPLRQEPFLPPSVQELRDQIGGVSLKRPSEEEWQLAMASPYAEPTTHGQAAAKDPCKGQSIATKASPQGRPTPLIGVAARKGGRCRSRGQQPIGAAATHGHTHLQPGPRKGGRWCQPHGWPPLGRVATSGHG